MSKNTEIKRLEAENKLMRSTLEQYAEEQNWVGDRPKFSSFNNVWFDQHGYTLAQETLRKLEDLEPELIKKRCREILLKQLKQLKQLKKELEELEKTWWF